MPLTVFERSGIMLSTEISGPKLVVWLDAAETRYIIITWICRKRVVRTVVFSIQCSSEIKILCFLIVKWSTYTFLRAIDVFYCRSNWRVPQKLATLSIQAYSSTGTWQKETVLNLHLGKISVIKNLNWPDECPTRTSDIILMYENEQKFKIA